MALPGQSPAGGRSPRPFRGRSERGSVLFVALILALIIAIGLTTQLSLALTSMRLASRSYHQNAAMNLAEIGIEEALYSYNRLAEVPTATPQQAWDPYGWSVAADNSATRTIGGFSFSGEVTGSVSVYCSRYNPTLITDTPIVVAKAVVNVPHAPPMTKYVEVTLRKRSLFPRGMVVRESISADGGNLSLDSWDSADDGDPSTPLVAYSNTTRRATATIATVSAVDNAIDIGNGEIYGYISTANRSDGSVPTVAHGPTAVLTGDFSTSEFDGERISHDFEVTSFPPATPPTASYVNYITSNMGSGTLPRPGDTAASDGYYYYSFSPGTALSLNSNFLDISGKVTLVLTNHSGVNAMTFGGSSGMRIAAGAALRVYTNGNVSVNGTGGFSNANSEASSCVFFGTHVSPGGQTFALKGNGQTSVSMYAPNAVITMTGGGSGGDFFGALVGDIVRMTGTTRFHYDEALSRMFVGKVYTVSKWRELKTAEERQVYATALNF